VWDVLGEQLASGNGREFACLARLQNLWECCKASGEIAAAGRPKQASARADYVKVDAVRTSSFEFTSYDIISIPRISLSASDKIQLFRTVVVVSFVAPALFWGGRLLCIRNSFLLHDLGRATLDFAHQRA
jgi:hypothetical protein